MRLRIGRVRSALIIAPHADDEAIAACALIEALRRSRVRISILIVTDGGASHPNSRLWPRPRLVAERRRESRRAMRRLGLPAGAIEFLALPDGGLSADPRVCGRAVARGIARRRDVDLLIAPAIDDAHPDHSAIAMTATRFAGRRLTYRVWPPARGRRRSSALPAPGLALTKMSIVRGYRTQTGTITDAERGFNMSRREFAAFTRPIEFFREACA